MEKYLIHLRQKCEAARPIKRYGWKRCAIELNGRFEPKYRHDLSALLVKSYSEIRVFPHLYHVGDRVCRTYENMLFQHPAQSLRKGITTLDFDNKGIYLVSATKSGCLTVHDFESLYCQSIDSLPSSEEDEKKHVLHFSLDHQIDCARWNLADQYEVACTSTKKQEVLIFDIGYVSSQPTRVLRTKKPNSLWCNVPRGLTDVAFDKMDGSRVVASDTYGVINIWDKRSPYFPSLELTTESGSPLNSIQMVDQNQTAFGADTIGMIHLWDLRGGRISAGFQSLGKGCYPPVASFKVESMLEKIGSLKAQAAIVSQEIHSIDLNPSCPHQLAFHLDGGWSGILDTHSFQVTHIHCPPPAWLNSSSSLLNPVHLRKPSWLSSHSIYVVGSSSDDGVHLIDFYPDCSSPSHIDYSENIQGSSELKNKTKKNRFIPLSEGVVACAAHPLNGSVIAGTKDSSLILISQQQQSC